MAPSFPSPSESPSDWSSSLSECGASSSSSNAASMATANGYLDFYPTPDLPVGAESRNYQQQAIPAALLPSSGTATSCSIGSGGNRQPPITPDGQLKPYSPASSPRRKRYAAEDDWRSHRDRISSLYQSNRLRDVITVMETQHQFFATERMYKARFKEWGLEKNVTAAKVHKLMQRVEEAERREMSPSRSGGRGGNERVLLDVGEDLDVKRIQKYMKRKPVGLGKLWTASKRSLEVIKSLSVDTKGGSARGRVSIPAVKLNQRRQQSTSELSLSTSSMEEWPSEPELPTDIIWLLQAFMDNHFDCPYPFASIGNSSFTQAPRHDEEMLDLALKFRIAHTLLDDGLAGEGMRAVNACLESLAFCVQQAQHASPLDTRPATQLMLWAMSMASEMMSDSKHSKKLMSQTLFQRMTSLCAGYQPTMAELANRISQLRSSGQVAMLKLARRSISQALFVADEHEVAFATYSKIVEIAESPLSSGDKFQALQRMTSSAIVRSSPVLEAWMEARIALSVSEAPSPFVDSLGPYGEASSPSWQAQGYDRMGEVVGAIAGRLEWHKAAGNWPVAQQLESRYRSIIQTVWGYNETASQGTAGNLDVWSSAEPVTSSLAPVEPGGFHLAVPEMNLRIGHLMGEIPGQIPAGEIPGWEELQQQHQTHQAQIPSQSESPSTSPWNAADPSQWQMDPDFGLDRGRYDGSY